MEQAF